jgi:radical SAM superfamily enzyme YgiQ (UPF0313 family)
LGYESGDQQILDVIKKGVRLEVAREFTKNCRELGVLIHGTFILGLPYETKETIENTITYAKELDVFSIQVSLAAPYPGTELYEMARHNGWFANDRTGIVNDEGIQEAAPEYPDLSKEDLRVRGAFLSAILPASAPHPSHRQDDARGSQCLRSPNS